MQEQPATHTLDLLAESSGSRKFEINRDQQIVEFDQLFPLMDGADFWAVVFCVLPKPGEPDDASTSHYLQAAGSAAALTIEYCAPDGSGSLRSVVGHAPAADDPLTAQVPIPPHVKISVAEREIFTADEAVTIFETFFRTDAIPDELVLRPVERFTAD